MENKEVKMLYKKVTDLWYMANVQINTMMNSLEALTSLRNHMETLFEDLENIKDKDNG